MEAIPSEGSIESHGSERWPCHNAADMIANAFAMVHKVVHGYIGRAQHRAELVGIRNEATTYA